MAVAGSTVNCIRYNLVGNKLIASPSERSVKELVETIPAVAAKRLLRGEKDVRLEHYGDNKMQLERLLLQDQNG